MIRRRKNEAKSLGGGVITLAAIRMEKYEQYYAATRNVRGRNSQTVQIQEI